MPNKSVPQLGVLPSPVQAGDLFHVVRGGIDYQSDANNTFGVTLLTYVQAQALIVANGIIPTQSYYVYDMPNDLGGATQEGGIFLTGLTTSLFNLDGVWIRPTNLKAFGYISFAGGSGSVDQLNVSTVGDIMNGIPVAFTTTLAQLAIDVATNINSFNLMRAVAVQNGVVIEALAAGTGANFGVITPSYTTITTADDYAGNPLNKTVQYGESVTNQQLYVKYDLPNNAIIYCEDVEENISFTMPFDVQQQLNGNSINNFRWGDLSGVGAFVGHSTFSGCLFETIAWQDFFVYPDVVGSFLQNIMYAGQYYQSILINSTFSANQHDGLCNLSNCMFNNSFVGRGNFYGWNGQNSSYDSFALNDSSFKDVVTSGSEFINLTLSSCIFGDTEDIFQNLTTWRDVICSGSILKSQYDIAIQLGVQMDGGGAGYGQVGVPFNLFPIPNEWSPFGQSITKGATLVGGGASLEIGIDSDTDCIMTAIAIASVNSVNREGILSGLSVANGWIVGLATGANITSGSFLVRVLGQGMAY